MDGCANARPYLPGRADARDRVRDLRARSPDAEAGPNRLVAAAHRGRAAGSDPVRRPSPPAVTVTPLTDREEVARIISKYDLLAVPVVDRGQVIGIVTVDD